MFMLYDMLLLILCIIFCSLSCNWQLVNLCCFWQDGDLDLNASPQALDKLLGHVLAFKVRIQSKFKNAVVLRYSKDLDLINVVLEMLPDSEVFFSDIYFSRCCHGDMIHEFDYHQLIYGACMFQNRSFQC